MPELSNVKIRLGAGTHPKDIFVEIEDEYLPGVLAVNVSGSVENTPIVTLTLVANVKMDIKGIVQVKPEQQEVKSDERDNPNNDWQLPIA